MLKLGLGITGSFCSMDDLLYVIKELKNDYEIEVFLTPHVNTMNTRFYSSDALKEMIVQELHQPFHTSIQDAEVYGPMKKLDAVLIYPCDASTLNKLHYGINDNAVTMLVKSSLRNQVPIVLGVYSNDILSQSGQSLMALMGKKNYYVVPMYQDNYRLKPNSMIACRTKVKKTLEKALQHEQYQPVMLGYKEV